MKKAGAIRGSPGLTLPAPRGRGESLSPLQGGEGGERGNLLRPHSGSLEEVYLISVTMSISLYRIGYYLPALGFVLYEEWPSD
jgi:hypothetical protein